MDEKPSKETPKLDVNVDLLQRIEKLEKEKKELAESVKMLKLEEEGKKPNKQMGKGVNSTTILEESKDKNVAREERNRQAITIFENVERSLNDLRKEMEKNSAELKKMAEDSVLARYETQAISIENEEKRKKEKEEMVEEMRRLQREIEERIGAATSSDRYESIATAIAALQDSVDKISARMEKLEESVKEQNNIHKKTLQKLGKEDGQLISGQANKNTILMFGGRAKPGWISTPALDEMFILGRDRWIELALKLPKPFVDGGAVYLDGELYIFGGSLKQETYKLDRETLQWTRLADMNEERHYVTNSYLEWEGSVWVFGGWKLRSVERYEPKENEWVKMPGMRCLRHSAAAAAYNGKFIICGGHDGSNYLTSVECFDPESGVWTELTDIPRPLCGHSLVSYGTRLILIGGESDKEPWCSVFQLSNLEGKGTWKRVSPMEHCRSAFSKAILNDEIFVIGGWDGTSENLDKTEIFNGETWRDGPFLHYPCWDMFSVVIPSDFASTLHNYRNHGINP